MLPYSYLVLGVTPVSNEAGVELNPTITISFAKHMDTATLNTGTIRFKKVNGDFINYEGHYSPETKEFKIIPSIILEHDTQYQTVVIGGMDGVRSIDGGYLPATKTYEFVTVENGNAGSLVFMNLTLQQDYLFIKAKWDMPSGLVIGEKVLFNVKVSELSNPEGVCVWPNSPEGGYTTVNEMTIPYKLEEGKNYYVHVQALTDSGDRASEWLTSQIYIEPIEQPAGGTGSVTEPGTQLAIEDHFPSSNSYEMPTEIVIVFNDNVKAGQESLLYVVAATPKESLSLIDLRGVYSPTKAIPGTVSIDTANPNVFVWKPTGSPFVQGKEYTVILSKQLQGVAKSPIGYTYTFGFTATPQYLYGNMTDVRDILGTNGVSVSNHFLQSLNRKYSQYAYEIWSQTTNFDESLLANGNVPYFLEQYVTTQIAIDSLLNMGIQSSGSGDETMQLGQLHVSKKSTTVSTGTSINQLKSRLKRWEDTIHGHKNRGYAKPGNVVKGQSASAYPTYLTRSTEKDFDK